MPGSGIPPPALFLGTLALGIALEWLWPLVWLAGLSPALRHGIGGALVLAGAGLMVASLRLFRRAGTAIPPWEPSSALVTSDVYRFSRNPIYLSLTAIYLGLAIGFGASWALLLLIPTLILLQVAVIRREEAYLERRFGAAYRHYSARVRRWI